MLAVVMERVMVLHSKIKPWRISKTQKSFEFVDAADFDVL